MTQIMSPLLLCMGWHMTMNERTKKNKKKLKPNPSNLWGRRPKTLLCLFVSVDLMVYWSNGWSICWSISWLVSWLARFTICPSVHPEHFFLNCGDGKPETTYPPAHLGWR